MASHYRRFIVVASFVATPILALVTAAFEPDLSGSVAHQLAVIGSHRQSATVSAIAFVLMQLPMLVIAIFLSGALVRRGAHRLGNLAGSLVAVSAFAHSIIGGSMLITVTMSETSLDRKQMAALLLRIHHTAPYHLLALLGIAGFVLGWAFFTAALWRTRLIPRILSAAIPAFIALEFIVSAAIPRASLAGALLFATALAAIGHALLGRDQAAALPAPHPA